MGRQLLKNYQISGVKHETLQEDIQELLSKAKYYNTPVESVADLPRTDNVDGEMRLVMDEDNIYVWHENVSSWRRKLYISTERRMTLLPVVAGANTDYSTNIGIGVADGIIDLLTVGLIINGVWQNPDIDYAAVEDEDNPGKLKIKWLSKDFNLESDDVIYVIYDIIKLR